MRRSTFLAVIFALLCVGLGAALGACANARTQPEKDAGVVDPGGDAGPQRAGHNATATVPGGVKARSTNYKLIGTTGKGETNSPSSPNYKVRTGVVGASQE